MSLKIPILMMIYYFQTHLLKNKKVVTIKIVKRKYKILALIVSTAMIDFVKNIFFQKYMGVVTKHQYRQKINLNSHLNQNNVTIYFYNIYKENDDNY